jgi:hypothetical protein
MLANRSRRTHPGRRTRQTPSRGRGWRNLLNEVRQTFRPSMPRLTGVQVELVVANPGPSDDELTMTMENPEGETLALLSKTVPVGDCDVLFVFPNGGLDLEVTPGQVYSIQLSGGSLFGWKSSWVGTRNGRLGSMANLCCRAPAVPSCSGHSVRIKTRLGRGADRCCTQPSRLFRQD